MRYYRISALLALTLGSLIAFGCGGNEAFLQFGAPAQTAKAPDLAANRHRAWDGQGKCLSVREGIA